MSDGGDFAVPAFLNGLALLFLYPAVASIVDKELWLSDDLRRNLRT
jgi:hypothetical protein